MRKFGLIGFPLGHSFSKQYFSDKFINESLPDCSYENFELKYLDIIRDFILTDPELCGLNITIPYKSEIIKYLDETDNEAFEIGAINVIKISYNDDKLCLKGFNTDIFGFRESLLPNLKDRKIAGAIILGAGGSSKAVSYVLNKLNIGFIQVSRKPGEKCITYNDLTDEMLIGNKLIINTTPLGMYPDIQTKPAIHYDCLAAGNILFDLVYNPSVTSFLKKGKEQGCKIISGLEMLHLQAEKAWEIWNDKSV
jgi:shikimate dehydrogenase